MNMNMKYIFYYLLFIFIELIQSGKVIEINDNLSEVKYKNLKYIYAYTISHSLMTFESNGGSLTSHDISLAFDNNFKTYWFSKQYQTDSFLTNIQVTFSKTVTIDRMIYQAPTFPKVVGYGYPNEIKIYFKLRRPDGTLSDKDSDFLLVDNIISERTGNKVVFIFDEKIVCDQIKLEWIKIEETISNKLTAHASEIIFLYPENKYINKLIYDVYDSTGYHNLFINQKYNDINIINEIEENLGNSLDILENTKELIDRGKKIINGKLKYEKRREFTTNQSAKINIINQHGNLREYSKTILKMSKGTNDRQPTGIYGFSNEEIVIYVDCNDDDPLPSILFSQFFGGRDWISNPKILQKGKNVLKIDEFDIKKN